MNCTLPTSGVASLRLKLKGSAKNNTGVLNVQMNR